MSLKVNEKCLICQGPLVEVVQLGQSALANELHLDATEPFETFPLTLSVCKECWHLQNSTLVPEERLYSHYLYLSDTGQSNQTYFQNLAKYLQHKTHAKNVLDIGSNDGLFLSYCQTRGMKVLGVDPAKNLAVRARDKKVQTITKFFSPKVANQIREAHGEFDLITCFNCFAHNADLTPILQGVQSLLTYHGVFVVEVVYAPKMLEQGLFDLCYHEHIHHWTVAAMRKLVAQNDLRLYHAEFTTTHGGSMRFFITNRKGSHHPINISVNKLIKEEAFKVPALISTFNQRITDYRVRLVKGLLKMHKEGKKIAIVGYPAKAATYLSFTNISQFISDIYDPNPMKVGRITPAGKEIKSLDQLYIDKIDVALCLSWNYEKQLRMQLIDLPMSWIIPFPELIIYDHRGHK
jgi:SAM-dependent methyltransferase